MAIAVEHSMLRRILDYRSITFLKLIVGALDRDE